jgi:hypothetical protein
MLYTVKDHDIHVSTMETSHHCAMRHTNFVHCFINVRSVPIVMQVPEQRPEWVHCHLVSFHRTWLLLKNILLWSKSLMGVL